MNAISVPASKDSKLISTFASAPSIAACAKAAATVRSLPIFGFVFVRKASINALTSAAHSATLQRYAGSTAQRRRHRLGCRSGLLRRRILLCLGGGHHRVVGGRIFIDCRLQLLT